MTERESSPQTHPNGGKGSMKLRIIISSVILYLIAVGFSTIFNLSSFDKLYIESNVSEYLVIGRDLQRKLESGLRYGKILDRFIGIDKLISEAKTNVLNQVTRHQYAQSNRLHTLKAGDITISITKPNGTIVYSDNQELLKKRLPKEVIELQSDSGGNSSEETQNYTKYESTYFTMLPVKNTQQEIVGCVIISFAEKQIKAFLDNLYSENLKPVFYIFASGLLLLIGLIHIIIPSGTNTISFSKKKIYFVIFAIIASVQILNSAFFTYGFKEYFLNNNRSNTSATTKLLVKDIEHLLSYGIRVNHLTQMEEYIGKVIIESPELSDITLYDRNGHPLYRATKTRRTDFQNNEDCYDEWLAATKSDFHPDYHVKSDLIFQGEYKGHLAANTSKKILFEKIAGIGIDAITVVVISILFFVELLILIFKYIERQAESDKHHPPKAHYGIMRPAAFLSLFGIDLSVSFLPLHMESLYIPILGLSKDTIMGLPISVEFMFVGVAILIAGVWLDRRGWHEPFIAGLLTAATGILYSWLAPDAVHFILSRGIVGIGYGLSMMASQGFVITHTDARNKASGLAHLFAGIYAGSICGAATGGMLAEYIGYKTVFMVGVIITGTALIYTFLFLRNNMNSPVNSSIAVKETKSKQKTGHLLKFLTNRTVLSLIFFSSLPSAIAVVGFLNYFSPIYLNRIGASQSTIGQVLMIYGICLIYFGPIISRYIDALENKRFFIFLGCVLGSSAFIVFLFIEGIVAAILAIFLLGLSSSIVLASQAVYALQLKVTKELGEGKALGIFRATSRIGQVLGPVIFSALIAVTDINRGIAYFGAAYLLAAFLFLLLSHPGKQRTFMTKEQINAIPESSSSSGYSLSKRSVADKGVPQSGVSEHSGTESSHQ